MRYLCLLLGTCNFLLSLTALWMTNVASSVTSFSWVLRWNFSAMVYFLVLLLASIAVFWLSGPSLIRFSTYHMWCTSLILVGLAIFKITGIAVNGLWLVAGLAVLAIALEIFLWFHEH